MFASFGTLQFEVLASPSKWEGRSKFRYETIAVIGASPINQWIYDDLKHIDLVISFHQLWCNPQGAINQFEALAMTHVAQNLVLGNGTNLGKYIILELRPKYRWMADDGTLLYAEIEVELQEDVDAASPLGAPQLSDSTALGVATPAIITPQFNQPGTALAAVPASAAPTGIPYQTDYTQIPLGQVTRGWGV